MRQYLQARLVDEMHVAVSPILLGTGERAVHYSITRATR